MKIEITFPTDRSHWQPNCDCGTKQGNPCRCEEISKHLRSRSADILAEMLEREYPGADVEIEWDDPRNPDGTIVLVTTDEEEDLNDSDVRSKVDYLSNEAYAMACNED